MNDNGKIYPYSSLFSEYGIIIQNEKDIRLNGIGCFIRFTLDMNDDPKDKNIKSITITDNFKNFFRSFLLDIGDFLKFNNLILPVVAVFENINNEEDYKKLHKLAGDQGWHRGDFSVIVSKEKIWESIVKDHFEILYLNEIKEITLKDIADFIVEQSNNLKMKDEEEEEMYKELLKLIENKLRNHENLEEGVEEWKNYVKNKIKKNGEDNE